MSKSRWRRTGFVAALTVAVCDSPTAAAAPKDEIAALIDTLERIADGDVGYMPTQTGGGFLPLGVSENGALLLGQSAPSCSDTLGELVKGGAAAEPHLIAHLDDKRSTQIKIDYKGGSGGMFFDDEYDYNGETRKRPPEGVNRDSLRAGE